MRAWELGTVAVLAVLVPIGYGWLCALEVRLRIQQARLALHICRDPAPVNRTTDPSTHTKDRNRHDTGHENDHEQRSISVAELLTRERDYPRPPTPPRETDRRSSLGPPARPLTAPTRRPGNEPAERTTRLPINLPLAEAAEPPKPPLRHDKHLRGDRNT